MNTPDRERQLKLLKIKDWEHKQLTFIEIVTLYNAEFGTDHFLEVLTQNLGYKATLVLDKEVK